MMLRRLTMCCTPLLCGLLAACGGGGSSTSGVSSSGGGSSGASSSGTSSSSSGGSSSSSSGGDVPSVRTDVTTYKNDPARDGANLTETVLTPANVGSGKFGLLRMLSVDGAVDAQPLYLAQLSVAGALHDVLFVATEHDSVYAFDANTGAILWQVSLLGSGETPSEPPYGCGQVAPQVGVTATPVVDRKAGTIFLVAMSKDGNSNYHQRLHALDITTGAERSGSPAEIQATYTSAGGSKSTFDPKRYKERPALLLLNGVVYTSWSSHCDISPYGGWVIGYNQSTLAQTTVLNVAPSNNIGPSIWMAGGGLAADSGGNIYALTGNGAFETTLDGSGFPSGGDYGSSFLKLSATGGTLKVADYATLHDPAGLQSGDVDLGSSGVMLLPDLTDNGGTLRHLVVGAGKDGNIYVVNRDDMGKFNPMASATSDYIWQQLDGVTPGGVFSTPAYFNHTVYYSSVNGTLKAFSVTDARLSSSPTSQTANTFNYPGTSPAISASGASNGIVWAIENDNPAVLHAYDATNLANQLYTSGGDMFGPGNKYITPTVADGKVFIATANSIGVFGLSP